jgi:hypothetical protein
LGHPRNNKIKSFAMHPHAHTKPGRKLAHWVSCRDTITIFPHYPPPRPPPVHVPSLHEGMHYSALLQKYK